MESSMSVYLYTTEVNSGRLSADSKELFRAQNWNLEKPQFRAKIELKQVDSTVKIVIDQACQYLENGTLASPIEQEFLSMIISKENINDIQRVSDSSRYFLLRPFNPNTKQKVYLGIGFDESVQSNNFYENLLGFLQRKSNKAKINNSNCSKIKSSEIFDPSSITILNLENYRSNSNSGAAEENVPLELPMPRHQIKRSNNFKNFAMDVSVQADDEADTTSKCATSQKSSFENDQNLTEMLENSKKCSKTLPEKLKMMCKKLNSLDQSCINVQNNLSKLFGVIKGKEKQAALKKNEALAKKVKTYFDQWEKMSLNKIEMAESMYNLVDSKIQEVDKNIEIFDQNLKEISKSTNDQRFKSMTGVTSAFNDLNANLEDNQNEEITNNDASLNIEMPIDAYEPLYCVCNRVSFGKMVACDNPSCKIEWFHFECVGLKKQPKGEWYCGECLPKPNVSKLD